MTSQNQRILQIVDKLLTENKISQPPIPIERIARKKGIIIRKQKNAEIDISGILIRQADRTIVGVNASHTNTRQRFTIAHELGHFLLHRPKITDSIHVDRGFVKFRDSNSSLGTDKEEREANSFAAELLMPNRLLAKDLSKVEKFDLVEDNFIVGLARKYEVSTQAMVFRLINLGYLK